MALTTPGEDIIKIRNQLNGPVALKWVLTSYLGALAIFGYSWNEDRKADNVDRARAAIVAKTLQAAEMERAQRVRGTCRLFNAEYEGDKREVDDKRSDLRKEKRRYRATVAFIKTTSPTESPGLYAAIKERLPELEADIRSAKNDLKLARSERDDSVPPSYCADGGTVKKVPPLLPG